MPNAQPKKYMSSSDLAEYLGLSPGAISLYKSKNLLPTPDVQIGSKRPISGWTKQTIDQWTRNRPGRGYRTDLYGRE